jgi:hypothetical protein
LPPKSYFARSAAPAETDRTSDAMG